MKAFQMKIKNDARYYGIDALDRDIFVLAPDMEGALVRGYGLVAELRAGLESAGFDEAATRLRITEMRESYEMFVDADGNKHGGPGDAHERWVQDIVARLKKEKAIS